MSNSTDFITDVFEAFKMNNPEINFVDVETQIVSLGGHLKVNTMYNNPETRKTLPLSILICFSRLETFIERIYS